MSYEDNDVKCRLYDLRCEFYCKFSLQIGANIIIYFDDIIDKQELIENAQKWIKDKIEIEWLRNQYED